MKSKFFFLHFGPGGNCDADRHYLAAKTDQIYFWDQPPSKSYVELSLKVEQEFKEFAKNHDCLGIIGHSFGCDLALDLVSKLKNPVPLILIAPIHDLITAFLNLAARILDQAGLESDVRAAIKSQSANLTKTLKSSSSLQPFWDFVFTLYRYPDIGRLFWTKADVFSDYSRQSSNFRPVDMAVWQNVLADYIQNDRNIMRAVLSEQSKIRVILGSRDPYYNGDPNGRFWTDKIGIQNVTVVDQAGHYPHIEDFSQLQTALQIAVQKA